MGNNFFDSYQQAEEQLNARDDIEEEEKTTILGILERLFWGWAKCCPKHN